jgi:hypothetical protein
MVLVVRNIAELRRSGLKLRMPTFVDLFQRAGWNMQWKETSPEAQQQVRYLGVEVDSQHMEYRLPVNKLEDIKAGYKKVNSCDTVN